MFFSFFVFFGFLEVSKKQRFYQSPQKFLEFWNFGKLEVFWKFGEVKKKLVFGKFAKLKKHLSCAKIQKSQDYAYILEYFWNFRKNSVVCNLSVSFVSIICFHVLIHSVHFLNCSS